MRKLRLLTLSSLAILFIASSCTKEGPEGPAGATGAQGPAGSAGAPGAPGAGQTTYSAWFLTGAGWIAGNALDYNAELMFDKAAPGVTQSIIDQGIVLCYGKGFPLGTNTAAEVVQLPFTEAYNVDHYFFVLSAGRIRFLYSWAIAPYAPADLATISFRYVLIPGSTSGGRSMEKSYKGFTEAEWKAMPYEKAAKLLDLPLEGSNIR